MNLKYKSSDVEKMIDVFGEISNNRNNLEKIAEEIKKIVDYPVNVINEFITCMNILNDKDANYLKENYWGIVGYTTMRLNFCV